MSTTTTIPSGVATQVSAELYSRYSLQVNHRWLLGALTTVKAPLPPIPVLVSTVHFRILNSDLTQSLATSASQAGPSHQLNDYQPMLMPPDVANVNTKSTTLPVNVHVQLLAITDIGSSKGNQIEAIERYERGEEVRGREIIRNVPIMNELHQSSDATAAPTTTTGLVTVKKSQGPHKLLLQDAAGTKVYGFELAAVPKVFMTNTADEGGINIGCKLLLKQGCAVRRGLIMLTPQNVTVLGGKVEEWDAAWRKGKKERLVNELKAEQETTRTDGDEVE